MAKRVKTKALKIKNCRECPHMDTRRTLGAGYAEDWICRFWAPDADAYSSKIKKIAGYIEWASEEPQDGDFPKWCPL